MSQFNFGTIDPNVKTGTELAADLNQWRDALHTTHAGVARPAYATPGLLWVDQASAADWRLKMATASGDVLIGSFNSTTNQRNATLFPDGTVGAPSIAFANEPGLGWYRFDGGDMTLAASSARTAQFSTGNPVETILSLWPRASGGSTLALSDTPGANGSIFQIYVNPTECRVHSFPIGSGTAKPIHYYAPSHNFTGQVICDGNLFAGTGGSNLGLVSTVAGERSLRFQADGWRLQFDTANGSLSYRNAANVQLFVSDGNGAFIVKTQGYKPGGGPWVDSSDGRIKDDIADYTSGLDAVLALRPVTYNFKAETGRDPSVKYVGLIGQEAECAMPEMVTTRKDKLGDLEFDDMRTLDANALTYALVNAVKTLNERIVKLEGA
jgi:hypothetical protein